MSDTLSCFKAYDIRGQLGSELDKDIAYRIGRAFGELLVKEGGAPCSKTVVVGGDIRHSSEELKLALADGLMDSSVNVIDIGMTGTEEIYFATHHLQLAGGVEVTASHNPIDYNGMKLVREHAKPVSGDTGLFEIKHLAELNDFRSDLPKGSYEQYSNLSAYVEHLLTYIDNAKIKPLRLVVNSGNGAAGHVVDELESAFSRFNVPIEFIKVHHDADGDFPNGIPNPLLPECRADTSKAVIEYRADFGIAWDGDFDRCFLFDESGEFIEGYYIVGLLAEAFLQKRPSEKIIHDPRLTWNTIDMVEANGGTAVMSKTGHAFIKERMRKEDAIYGGEMSAHHYFRDFAYCDSGMIPWLLIAELLCVKGKPLSELVKERIAAFPSPGEINSIVDDADVAIERVLARYRNDACLLDGTDGISLEFDIWRFNLRKSNTEPLLRLNIESRGDRQLLKAKTNELLRLIRQ
ncbi:phosphomannomutase CpsG [Shewanella sp. Scap07]|uniref:phosphomannomutase CpsG n=1 Tax=Shewanella sp. Scap07 TaxID=2589987 RepID=UPI0015BD2186|nr:phosphomannomutase CpsG [Shewanella sp. Scap07]QLE86068.1 phosphomannomutase CpsG [Shewanella sp. Scap07]